MAEGENKKGKKELVMGREGRRERTEKELSGYLISTKYKKKLQVTII